MMYRIQLNIQKRGPKLSDNLTQNLKIRNFRQIFPLGSRKAA
jgi:hypothetical protein